MTASQTSDEVVVTGMGVISPIGHDVSSFEANLFAGRHGIVPIDHFDTSDIAVKLYAPVGHMKAAEAFTPSELRRFDEYSLFGLLAARQAIEESDVLGSVDPYRLSVFMSTGLGGVYTSMREFEKMQDSGPRKVSPLLIPNWIANMLSGIISIEIGAQGPSYAHVAACASSATSIGEGMRAIRHGYADVVVCGGAEALTHKLAMAGFQNLRALTSSADPDRASIPFDQERSGFVMGEGAAALILESRSHAEARGATIHATIAGYGMTSDAHHITAPADDGVAGERAMLDALAEAGERDGKYYVNAHGTSTVKNDRSEAGIISRALGDRALVSSTKSMTGHLIGAAGAVEAIACVLALQQQIVPPTAGTETIDSDMTIDVVRGEARPAEFARAVSLSLGFGGHNVSLVIDAAEV